MLYLIVFFSSLLLTAVIRQYALRKDLLDIPNFRSSHSVPTPSGGGLSIVLCFVVVLALMYFQNRLENEVFYALSGGGLLVASVGFWDDHHPISARWRISIHFLAAFWILYWIGGLASADKLPVFGGFGWLGFTIGTFFLVWLLNLYNFMDGIDGLAAVETIYIALSAGILILVRGSSDELATLLIVLAFSCLGFLFWNWPPAKIFMGDVGSGFLGLVLGGFVLMTSIDQSLPFWSWLILFGVFLVDATFTLSRRIMRGERWYEAHRSHAYQIASRLLGSHKKATMSVLIINIVWLLPLAMLASFYPKSGILWVIISYLPLTILAEKLGAGKT